MKPARILCSTILILVFCSVYAEAQEKIGEITYLEDGVTLTRNNTELDTVEIGTEVQNLDLIGTNESGLAEIKISSSRAPGTTIKVSPKTYFYFELGAVGKKNNTTVHMLSGSLAMKVQKLTGNQAVDIRTETAVMGIRGTGFQVTTAPSGDVLITAVEGKVSCVDEGGGEVFAVPGQAVEKRTNEKIRAVPVAVSSLDRFRQEWFAGRMEAFKANALIAIRNYSLRYQKLLDQFNGSYADLMTHQAVIDKWIQEDRRNTTGTKIELLREKKALIGGMLRMRKVLFIFERVYYRLQELADYHAQGYGRGQIQVGLSTDDFFRRLGQDRRELEEKMASLRYLVKLYAKRNEGSFPADFSEENGDTDSMEAPDDFLNEE